MSERRRIKCINKADRESPYERIHSIGGKTDGNVWHMSLDQAVAAIKSGSVHFVVAAGDHRAAVEIVKGKSGKPFLRTVPDGQYDDNLLSLPECPRLQK